MFYTSNLQDIVKMQKQHSNIIFDVVLNSFDSMNDPRVIQNMLDVFKYMQQIGSEMKDMLRFDSGNFPEEELKPSSNSIFDEFLKNNNIEKFQSLQQHPSDEVYKRTESILNDYFSEVCDD